MAATAEGVTPTDEYLCVRSIYDGAGKAIGHRIADGHKCASPPIWSATLTWIGSDGEQMSKDVPAAQFLYLNRKRITRDTDTFTEEAFWREIQLKADQTDAAPHTVYVRLRGTYSDSILADHAAAVERFLVYDPAQPMKRITLSAAQLFEHFSIHTVIKYNDPDDKVFAFTADDRTYTEYRSWLTFAQIRAIGVTGMYAPPSGMLATVELDVLRSRTSRTE